MKKFESMENAGLLKEGGPLNPDTNYETVEEVVDDLVSPGNTDKVLYQHENHFGLRIDSSESCLKSPFLIFFSEINRSYTVMILVKKTINTSDQDSHDRVS